MPLLAVRVASKVLTPERVGKEGLEKVVDSKRMTPATERDADESKDCQKIAARHLSARAINPQNATIQPIRGVPCASASLCEVVLVDLQRCQPLPSVLDHRERILAVEAKAGGRRLVKAHCRDIPEFRHPVLDISRLRVKPFALGPRILNPKIGSGVRAGSGTPLPASVVAGEVEV